MLFKNFTLFGVYRKMHWSRRFHWGLLPNALRTNFPPKPISPRSEIFSLSSCGSISFLGLSLRRYYLGYLYSFSTDNI